MQQLIAHGTAIQYPISKEHGNLRVLMYRYIYRCIYCWNTQPYKNVHTRIIKCKQHSTDCQVYRIATNRFIDMYLHIHI